MDTFLSFLKSGFSTICDILSDVANAIVALLPTSPFSGFTMPREFQDVLGYINWVIPFGMICNTLLFWLSAISIYYTYQAILRLTKSIE